MSLPTKQSETQSTKSTATNGSFFGGGDSTPFFQAKLSTNQPGIEHKQEADTFADQVMRMKKGNAPIVQRSPTDENTQRDNKNPPEPNGDPKKTTAQPDIKAASSMAEFPTKLGFRLSPGLLLTPKIELLSIVPPSPSFLTEPVRMPNKPALSSSFLVKDEKPDPNYPIIPAPVSSESRSSTFVGSKTHLRFLPGVSYLSFQEITPPQHRLQWGKPTFGARLDSYSALRFGNEKYHFDFGMRSTDASSEGSSNQMSRIENQRIGYANLRLNWFTLAYWNDHAFWWWPLADGGDKGDTAGLRLGYLPQANGLPVAGNWKLTHLSLNLRIATGDPVRASAAMQGGRMIYQEVIRPDISRGDLMLVSKFKGAGGWPIEFGAGVSSGKIRHFVQSVVVHRSLGIPEFTSDNGFEGYFYIKISGK